MAASEVERDQSRKSDKSERADEESRKKIRKYSVKYISYNTRQNEHF